MSNFNSKEDYLKFITAWKAAANHTNNKKHRKVCDHVQYWNWDYRPNEEQKAEWKALGYVVGNYSYTIPDGGHYKTNAWLTGAHYILRNVLLGKEINRGFCPKGEKKRGEYEDPWMAFNHHCWSVERYIVEAKRFLEFDNEEACQNWIKKGTKGFFKKTTDRTSDQYYKMIEDRLKRVFSFLEPLGAAIDIEDLARIDLDLIRKDKEKSIKLAA